MYPSVAGLPASSAGKEVVRRGLVRRTTVSVAPVSYQCMHMHEQVFFHDKFKDSNTLVKVYDVEASSTNVKYAGNHFTREL